MNSYSWLANVGLLLDFDLVKARFDSHLFYAIQADVWRILRFVILFLFVELVD